jgi:hypothetical protein
MGFEEDGLLRTLHRLFGEYRHDSLCADALEAAIEILDPDWGGEGEVFEAEKVRRMNDGIETPRFMRLLKDLDSLLPRRFVVLIGSAALAVRGARDVRDLDVLVAAATLEAFRGGHHKLPRDWGFEAGDRAVQVSAPAGTIQISDRLSVHGPACEIDEVEVIANADAFYVALPEQAPQPWRVIALFDLVRLKKARGLAKDLEDLRLIESLRGE